jgi:hypothetical protein
VIPLPEVNEGEKSRGRSDLATSPFSAEVKPQGDISITTRITDKPYKYRFRAFPGKINTLIIVREMKNSRDKGMLKCFPA